MTQPLTGLSGLAGFQVQLNQDAQATPEERMGGAADPRHADVLAEKSIPRGSRMGTPKGPYGLENQLLGDPAWFWESGGEPDQDPQMDRTPSNRAGPWPKGILSGPIGSNGPDDTAPKLTQLAALHGIKTNAGARHQLGMPALNDEWETVEQVNSGNSDLEPASKQSMSSGYGWGTRDRVVSMARQNEFGFDAAHQHRRYATGSIPGNTMWLRPGGRPMAKTLAGPARPPIGVDSPFAGQDLGQAFSADGAILQNLPSEYAPPPNPALGKAQVSTENDSVVEWY